VRRDLDSSRLESSRSSDPRDGERGGGGRAEGGGGDAPGRVFTRWHSHDSHSRAWLLAPVLAYSRQRDATRARRLRELPSVARANDEREET